MIKEFIGREIQIKRATFKENMVIEEIIEITPRIFSVSGKNSKRRMTMTMTLNDIRENLIGGKN